MSIAYLMYLLCCGVAGVLLGQAYPDEPRLTLRNFLRVFVLVMCIRVFFSMAGWMP